MLKRTTKTWRTGTIVLHGYSDSPLAGMFILLRNNGSFEHFSSGIFRSYNAGKWVKERDTISLTYLNSHLDSSYKIRVFVEKTSNTLVFENSETPVYARMRIMLNALED